MPTSVAGGKHLGMATAAMAAASAMEAQPERNAINAMNLNSVKDQAALPASFGAVDGISRMNHNLAAQFLLRSPRENRPYDVPVIGKCASARL